MGKCDEAQETKDLEKLSEAGFCITLLLLIVSLLCFSWGCGSYFMGGKCYNYKFVNMEVSEIKCGVSIAGWFAVGKYFYESRQLTCTNKDFYQPGQAPACCNYIQYHYPVGKK